MMSSPLPTAHHHMQVRLPMRGTCCPYGELMGMNAVGSSSPVPIALGSSLPAYSPFVNVAPSTAGAVIPPSLA